MRIRASGLACGVMAASEYTGIPAPESIAVGGRGMYHLFPAVPGGSLSCFVALAMLPPRTSPSMTMPGAAWLRRRITAVPPRVPLQSLPHVRLPAQSAGLWRRLVYIK